MKYCNDKIQGSFTRLLYIVVKKSDCIKLYIKSV